MKIYVVYFRTMENSPEVTIRCATTNKAVANAAFQKAKDDEAEWMKDVDEDSGDWAEACMKSFNLSEKRNPGNTIYVVVETVWHEVVETEIFPFLYELNAKSHVKFLRQDRYDEYVGLVPYDGEPLHDAMHLEDPDVAVDIYYSIEAVTLE